MKHTNSLFTLLIHIFFSLFGFVLAFHPLALFSQESENIYLQLKPFSTFCDEVSENSGLIYWKNSLWTFNDSGGKNIIYQIDNEGNIKSRIEITHAKNIDWEEITQDDRFVYLGDFGNNLGNRKNLCIYKISKADIPDSSYAQVRAEMIPFSYEDQTDFTPALFRTAFDCEALIALGDSLYLFTKDWANATTTVYSLSKNNTQHLAKRLFTLQIKGWVTGAALSPSKNVLALIGYTPEHFTPFIILYPQFDISKAFWQLKKRKRFIFRNGTQTEGIYFKDENTLFVSSEKSKLHKPRVFVIRLSTYGNL